MYIKIKRIIDIIFSLVAIIILSPVLLIISIFIKLGSSGPALFKQKRIGKDKRHFYILKFRTMRTDAPSNIPTHLLKNPDTYITGIGKILRKTSLDELPQLFNILKGDMSIIGPRPALCNQFDLINKRDEYGANDILPGLTGWAQINGRDELPILTKAAFDGEYVSKMGFFTDATIFFETIRQVIWSKDVIEGANASDHSNTNEVPK